MKYRLINPTYLELSEFDEPGLEFELPPGTPGLSAIAMFNASLARCSFAVIDHYALQIDLDIEQVKMRVQWDFIENPTRISPIHMTCFWPDLEDKRLKAIERLMGKCTIHNTISDCTEIHSNVLIAEPDGDQLLF